MQRLKRTVIAGAIVAGLGLTPGLVAAQETNQAPPGGVAIDASGSNTVYQSDAGQSGERTVINRNPGVQAANNSEGQGNREERRAGRQADRQADQAAAPAAEPAAFEAAPAPEVAPVPEAAPAAPAEAAPETGVPAITALPSTGVGVGDTAPLAAALAALSLAAAGAAVALRRPEPR